MLSPEWQAALVCAISVHYHPTSQGNPDPLLLHAETRQLPAAAHKRHGQEGLEDVEPHNVPLTDEPEENESCNPPSTVPPSSTETKVELSEWEPQAVMFPSSWNLMIWPIQRRKISSPCTPASTAARGGCRGIRTALPRDLDITKDDWSTARLRGMGKNSAPEVPVRSARCVGRDSGAVGVGSGDSQPKKHPGPFNEFPRSPNTAKRRVGTGRICHPATSCVTEFAHSMLDGFTSRVLLVSSLATSPCLDPMVRAPGTSRPSGACEASSTRSPAKMARWSFSPVQQQWLTLWEDNRADRFPVFCPLCAI